MIDEVRKFCFSEATTDEEKRIKLLIVSSRGKIVEHTNRSTVLQPVSPAFPVRPKQTAGVCAAVVTRRRLPASYRVIGLKLIHFRLPIFHD